MKKNKDHLEQRCPKLGCPVSFQYCRTCGDDGLPCSKVFDCWWEYFDVVAYLKENLTESQFNTLAYTKPKPKIMSLVEIIEQAKRATTVKSKNQTLRVLKTLRVSEPLSFEEKISQSNFILTEASVIETLRRSKAVSLHPQLENALLIYDSHGKTALAELCGSFINIAQQAGVPILIFTPTWRANAERINAANIETNVNKDAVKFLFSLRDTFYDFAPDICVGGMMGCKNDAYKPEQALSPDEAEKFHSWQIQKLSAAEPDFLLAATLPAVSEAKGIARAMQKTGIPYFISFVINSKGVILDGTTLDTAFIEVDSFTKSHPPLGFMINCAYPSFLHMGIQTNYVKKRLIGFQGNASSKDHCDLEGSSALQMDDIQDWGDRMIELNQKYGLKILGGCCGTNTRHLEYLVKKC